MDPVLAQSVDLSESRQPNLYAATIIPGVFAFICVILRFWSRWTNRAGFWLDDWLVLCALSCLIGLWATAFWWIPRALGKHVQSFGPNVAEYLYIGLFCCELTYTGVIVFVKFSILALYWRIFGGKTNIKLPIIILTTLVFMWGTAVFLLSLLQCIPTRGFWDKTIEASCNVDSQKFLFAISIPNILIDVSLLILPAPYVLQLNVPSSQKTALVSMFALGGFVCIASIMRLVAVITESLDSDVTWNLINQATWAVVEANFAIISACLPTLRPVWLALRGKSNGTKLADPKSYQNAVIGTSQKRMVNTPSWATRMLRSSADDDDGQPLSTSSGLREDDLRHGLVPDPHSSKTTVAIPLSHVGASHNGEFGAIRVENGWDIEYSERRYSKGHV